MYGKELRRKQMKSINNNLGTTNRKYFLIQSKINSSRYPQAPEPKTQGLFTVWSLSRHTPLVSPIKTTSGHGLIRLRPLGYDCTSNPSVRGSSPCGPTKEKSLVTEVLEVRRLFCFVSAPQAFTPEALT